MKYDIIIIGAGLGGLTAGAKLAKEGKKVLVIEQHSKPGGCATTFKRGDYTLEVGLHEMDSPSPGEMKSRIFNDLEVLKKVEFIKVPEFYHFINGRYEITIPHDPEIAAERLFKLFPQEINGIKAYFNQLLTPRKKVQPDEPSADISVGEFLDSIIQNEDLKLILLGNLGYFHDDPYSLSFSYYSVAQGSYFLYGGSFIKGGSQKLSDYLAGYIKSHGGDVILNHLVTGIIVSDDMVKGVVYNKKNIPDSEAKTAYSDQLIANSSIPDLAGMLPGKYTDELKKDIAGEVTGPSLLTIYFGFKRSLKELGFKYYSSFIYDDSVTSLADILKNNKDDYSKRSFTFIDYGQIDSDLAPSGKSVGALCCMDYIDHWEKMSVTEYNLEKKRVGEIFIERLEKIIPGIRDVIEYHEVGTSATVKRYTLNSVGATHGFVHTPSRKANGYLKSLRNLYFASAWGNTGGGFSGAIYGGYLCALNIIRKKAGTIIK
jgi:all-trans-retinol 13,14-reductase